MATGAEFFAQLEKRFNQLSAEEKLDKIVEYQKKLTALKEQVKMNFLIYCNND